MKKKAISGIVLTLLLTGMLTLAFNIRVAGATGTIYIRADGSVEPSDAPISSVDNVTYTFTANINESIDVERDNIVVDGAGYTLQGTGSGRGIDLSSRSNVTIKSMEIKAFYYGIYLSSSSNNSISGNNITNNLHGIYILPSSYNTVSGNNITNNNASGIWIGGSRYNIISGNNITNNNAGIRIYYPSSRNIISGNTIRTNVGYGIYIERSSESVLRNNNMTGNGFNFGVSVGVGGVASHFVHDVDSSNTVDGKPIYYWVNRQNMEVPSDAGYVALVNSTNITVKELELKNNRQGVLLAYTNNSRIINNNITNNFNGIEVFESSGNSISENNIAENNEYGIYFSDFYAGLPCNNNTVSGNNITNNHYGIELYGFYYSHPGNTISGNKITNNSEGIRLYSDQSAYHTISGNKITNNVRGMYLYGSSWNHISGNIIANNSEGVWTTWSYNNKFYNNNFISNTKQVVMIDSGWASHWDDDYPSGGNYWSDYSGVDLYSGPYQNETGSDGIGDSPYVIDACNIDYYPLMNPWTPISWKYVFEDERRGTTLKISTDDKYFQFIAPDKTFSVKHDPNMTVLFDRLIVISFEDSEIKLLGIAIDTWIDFCVAFAKDMETGQIYWLVDRPDNWICGDIDFDGDVDGADFSMLGKAYRATPSSPNWDAACDIDRDDVVNSADLSILGKNYRKSI